MEARELLSNHLHETGVTAEAYAAERGVGRSVVYKFLAGKDIRLSTWERLKPPSTATPTPPGGGMTLPAHIMETPRGTLVCVCGQGVPLRGTWPKRRPKLRKDFVEKHRECGKTTTAREGEE